MIKDIPLIFNDPRYPGSVEREHLCLPYTIRPCDQSQGRFRGRLVATPAITLSEYDVKAVFDWLEIYLPTKGRHQARNVHSKLMQLNREHPGFTSCRVQSPWRKSGYTGDAFVIRLQDPQPEGLYGLLGRVLMHYCPEGTRLDEIPITGLELSLDIYPAKKLHFDEQAYAVRRMLMTELIRKHVSIDDTFRDERMLSRFVYADGKGPSKTQYLIKAPGITAEIRKMMSETGIDREDLAALTPKNHTQPCLDGTFYYGERNKRLFFKCMDKFSDRRAKEDFTELPFDKTRSRIEFTFMDEIPLDGLGPASVDLTHVDDLQLRGLVGFNELLRFDSPTFTPSEEDPNEPRDDEWMIFQKTGIVGLRFYQDVNERMKKTKTRREMFSSGQSLRYSGMNRRVAKALKRLEKRWGN